MSQTPSRHQKHRPGADRRGFKDTRERILRTAAILFRERGPEGTSLNAIAAELGITPPALYWHFPSKATLLQSVLEYTTEEFLSFIEANAASADPVDRLRQLVTAHTRWELSQLDLAAAYPIVYSLTMLSKALPRTAQRRVIAMQNRYVDMYRDTITRGFETKVFRSVDVTATAFAMIAMGDHLVSWFHEEGRLSADEIAELHADLAVRMVVK